MNIWNSFKDDNYELWINKNAKSYNGWHDVNKQKNVHDVRARVKVMNNNVPQAHEHLAHKLAKSIIEQGLIKTVERRNVEDPDITEVEGIINVVEPPTSYMNLEEKAFKVNGVVFTNEELVEAITNTFPEKLI